MQHIAHRVSQATDSAKDLVKVTGLSILLLLCFFIPLSGAASQIDNPDNSNDLSLQPSPALTPQQVVQFQLTALQQASDDGISATFRFASPANRNITGPVARFSRLFESPQYKPMTSNRGNEIRLISNDGSTAELLAGVVGQDGQLHWYTFRLSRQSQSPYEDCWMTDAVLAVQHPGDSA